MAIRLDARRELFRPMPMHFSRWGANREAAMFRWQLGQMHSAGRLVRAAAAEAKTSAAAAAAMDSDGYVGWIDWCPLSPSASRNPLLLVSSAPSKSDCASPVQCSKGLR